MSMLPNAIPEETIRVARAAFPRGNLYLTMRDQLGTLYENEHFPPPFRRHLRRKTSCHVNTFLG